MSLKRKCFGLYLNFVRYQHIYKTSTSYCPSSQLAKKLCDNLIYNNDGLIVINKPQGISFSQKGTPPNHDGNEVSLKTCLPHIKEILGCSDLYNVTVPEKFISGVAILCTSKQVLEKAQNILTRMRQLSIPQYEYCAVVLGNPLSPNGSIKGGITLLQSPNSKKEKKANIVTQWTQMAIKRGDVRKVHLSHSILKSNGDASIVSVCTTLNQWHCVRVYLSTKLLSPVLGDNIFGSRVKTLLGNPVLVDIFSPASSAPQKLPHTIQHKLGLEGRKDVAVPLHLHLRRITLHNFNGKESIEFFAEPPDNFKWTCECLSLV